MIQVYNNIKIWTIKQVNTQYVYKMITLIKVLVISLFRSFKVGFPKNFTMTKKL